MKKLEHTLKPLTVSMKFIIGLNLGDVNRKPIGLFIRFLVPAFGIFMIISHLAINGPCGSYSFTRNNIKFKWHARYTGNPNEIIPQEAIDYAFLIGDICMIPLFFFTPMTHIVLIGTFLLTKNWNDLWKILKTINFKMFTRRTGQHYHLFPG